jgi:hypothetical protein
MTPDSVADMISAVTPGKSAIARLAVVILPYMCDSREFLQAPVIPPPGNR